MTDLSHLCKREHHTIQHMILRCSQVAYLRMNSLTGGRKSPVKTFIYLTQVFYTDLQTHLNTINLQAWFCCWQNTLFTNVI